MPGRRWQSVGIALLSSSGVLSCDGILGLTDPTVADAGDEVGIVEAAPPLDAMGPGEAAGHVPDSTTDASEDAGHVPDSTTDAATDAMREANVLDATLDYGLDGLELICPPYCPDSGAVLPDAAFVDTGEPIPEGGSSLPSVVLVNAAPDLGPVRACFGAPGPDGAITIASTPPVPYATGAPWWGAGQPWLYPWAAIPVPQSVLAYPSFLGARASSSTSRPPRRCPATSTAQSWLPTAASTSGPFLR